MIIFNFKNYKKFVISELSRRPKGGRGQLVKLALYLSAPTSTLSQVFSGERDLTPEQACGVAEFLGLLTLETDYFLALVDLSRAGTQKLKQNILRRLETLRKQAETVTERMPAQRQLNEQEKFIFYSEWYYSAIRLLSALPTNPSVSLLAEFLDLPLARVAEVRKFLLDTGLLKTEGAKVKLGPSTTHLPATDPLVNRLHQNWREQAIARMRNARALSDQELFVTIPCTVSTQALEKIRGEILRLLETITSEIDQAHEETLACVNIDLFHFDPIQPNSK